MGSAFFVRYPFRSVSNSYNLKTQKLPASCFGASLGATTMDILKSGRIEIEFRHMSHIRNFIMRCGMGLIPNICAGSRKRIQYDGKNLIWMLETTFAIYGHALFPNGNRQVRLGCCESASGSRAPISK